jgi:uncharacterized SAM-binding protein YcdF (DUF218 family)
MFFDLSKSLATFISPSNILFLIGLAGLALLPTRFTYFGQRLLAMGYLFLIVAGISPLGYMLMLPLEERFPQWDASRGAPTGIIVLGGVIDTELSVARNEIALHEGAERVTAIAGLARLYPDARIVFSGGDEKLNSSLPAEADVAALLFKGFGISAERILRETHSRNTAENASFTKALINPTYDERWILVTSAAHMPRAIGAFRKIGFPVEAYPVDWQTKGGQDLPSFFGWPLGGLLLCDAAAHEWIGLLAYWLTGRTSALFPGP